MIKKYVTLKNVIWFCALGLATFSGYYSVFGISKLFSGGSYSIIGMAVMLEISKLAVVTFLHNHYNTLKYRFKVYLTLSAIILMTITSIGVYGYLTNSYQETAKVVNVAQNELKLIDEKIQSLTEKKIQIDEAAKNKTNRLSSLDKIRSDQESTYGKLSTTKRGTRNLQQNIKSVDNNITQLNTEISSLSDKSLGITDSISTLNSRKTELTNATYSSEMGPLLYLSNITGLPMDTVVNYLILLLVVVFDPLAVSLIIAANHLNSIPSGTQKVFSNLSGINPDSKNDHSSSNSEDNLPITTTIPELSQGNEDPVITEENLQVPIIDLDLSNKDSILDTDQLSNVDQFAPVAPVDQLTTVANLMDQEIDHNSATYLDQPVDQITPVDQLDQPVDQVTSDNDAKAFYDENHRHRINRAISSI